MATINLTLTDTWQQISSGAVNIQNHGGNAIEIANADSLPTGSHPHDTMNYKETLAYNSPASGAWYGRCVYGSTVISATEMG